MNNISMIILYGVLFISVYYDIKSKRIPNKLIIIGYLSCFIISLIQNGPHGMIDFLTGSTVPLIILFILFLFRMIGAGDIKLLALAGGVLGLPHILYCTLAAFAVGAVLSLGKMLYNRNFLIRMQYLAAYISCTIQTKKLSPYYQKEEGDKNIIAFSPCILLGLAIYRGWCLDSL